MRSSFTVFSFSLRVPGGAAAARATAPASAGGVFLEEVHVDRLPAVIGQLLGDGDEG
jgi:hypothetical protein